MNGPTSAEAVADAVRVAAAQAAYRAEAEAARAAREARALPQPGDNPALVRRRNTEGRPHASGFVVTTWADGWGRYGATVTGPLLTDAARHRAAAAIRARFAEADGWGRGFRLRLDLVNAEQDGPAGTAATFTFREA